MRKRCCVFILLAFAVIDAGLPRVEAKDRVFTPDMTVQMLAGRKDSDKVQLPSGKVTTVGVLRRLDAAAQKIRSTHTAQNPSPMRMQPAATGIPVNTREEFLRALRTRSNSETVQFASGRRATLAQIRTLQPYLEKKLGSKLETLSGRPNLSGRATSVEADQRDKQFWKNVLQQPDATILESPHGKRITVGELKQYLGTVKPKRVPGNLQPASSPAQEVRQ